MGVGKLVWQPNWRAVQFTNAKYLELNDYNVGDLGTDDFRLACLLFVDSGLPGTYAILMNKWDGDLSNDTGWVMFYQKADRNLRFGCNDGKALQLNVETQAQSAPLDTWIYVVVEGDRDGYLTIYINGIIKGSANMSGYGGNLNKSTSKMRIDWDNYTILGKIGYAAIGKTIYGADYAREEYYQIIYGLPRQQPPWNYVWTFADTLSDISGQYEWNLKPSGTPNYVTGCPDVINLSLDYNYSFDYALDYMPLDRILRAVDGTGVIYRGPAKRRLHLSFDAMSQEQKTALTGAWYHRSPIDIYMDSDRPLTMTAMMVSPPQLRQLSCEWWSGEIELEEL